MREGSEAAAELAIGQVIARYARGIDRLDWDLVRSCYHPDATEDRGRFRGGVDEFVSWLKETLTKMESTWHLVGTPLIEVEGDVAYSEVYCLGIQYMPGAAEANLIPCRYCDRFERRDGEWRIARRVAVYEPTVAGRLAGRPLGAESRRDRSDIAYLRD